MPRHHPLDALKFSTPSVDGVRSKLPLHTFEHDREAAPDDGASGPSIGDEAMAHAEAVRANSALLLVATTALIVPDQDHFDMCDVIGNENSELVARILKLFSD